MAFRPKTAAQARTGDETHGLVHSGTTEHQSSSPQILAHVESEGRTTMPGVGFDLQRLVGNRTTAAIAQAQHTGADEIRRFPIYRGGKANGANLTPRTSDSDGLSGQSTLNSAKDVTKAWTNKVPAKVQVIESDNFTSPGKLDDPDNAGTLVDAPDLEAIPNGSGNTKAGKFGKWVNNHVSIRPEGGEGNKWLKAWQKDRSYEYTKILKTAITKEES